MHAIRHPDAAGITPGPAATPTSRLAWRGLGLWLAAVAWFAAFAWVRPLAMPDEGRYLSVAWEMLASGNWLVPIHDGLPFFHKPPLFYWLADAAMAVAGPSALAGRLPSIFAAAGLAWGVHAFDARWTGRDHARMVLLVLATTPYVYFAAQYANMDMLVAACIAGAVLCAAHAALRAMDGREPGPALVAAYGAAGAGVLAKGLIGFALPLAIVVAWLLFERRAKLLVRLVSPAGIALFLAIVLPWPLAMQARYPGFFDYFIVEQHVHRFAGAGFNNAQPWWFFLPVVLVLTMPWSVAVLPLWRGRAPAVHPPHRALRSLMACWALVVLAFFSIPQSKLIGYVLPAAAPLAWLMADALASSGPHRFARRRVCAVAGLSCFLLLAAVGVYAWRAPHSSRAVADVLASRRLAGEPVVFVGTYPYDLEFDAALRPPIAVVQDWADPALARRDSWPKELLDGARFAPEAANGRLVDDVLATAVPAGRTTWIVTPVAQALPPALHARTVMQGKELALSVVDESGPAPEGDRPEVAPK